ncbi:hypothetical protein Q9L58_007724 [Maublancomyces gigas]|uniref:BTB domain-containing protein n=1 Tax=Discina gigas TaxID=1032678 RepID=A0ABR3GBR6_9PEZI
MTYIDTNGDVVLLIGEATSLVVSSKVLSVASPVFAAMLSPHFREGSSLSSTCPTQIPLPDDPPVAVTTIVNILHFRNDSVWVCTFEELFDIALVADKYDLALALGPWRHVWLMRIPDYIVDVDGCPGQDSNRESREIFIRYVFKDPDGFEKVTKQAIIWGEGAEDVCEALPDWVAAGISKCRESVLRHLMSIADHYRLQYQSPRVKCRVRPHVSGAQAMACGAAVLGSLIRHYSELGIFPMPGRPYPGLSAGKLAAGLKGLRCFVDLDTGHSVCTISARIAKRVDAALDDVKGLELADLSGASGAILDLTELEY